jgi:hypothetical protein
MRVIDWIFKLEEINGDKRCPMYLYRWRLLRVPGCFAIYLHRFVGDDWARDQHDHPKRFISIGIWGSYIEETPFGERLYRAPWVRTFPSIHIHRLRLVNQRPCWTIVLVGPVQREWGFWQGDQWIQWLKYVKGDKVRRNCP